MRADEGTYLLDWVNSLGSFGRQLQYAERDFSSGYLFAQVMLKLGLLKGGAEGLVDFEDCDAEDIDAKLENFRLLNLSLRCIPGCSLSKTQVRGMVLEQRGTANDLLLRLKKVSEGRSREFDSV